VEIKQFCNKEDKPLLSIKISKVNKTRLDETKKELVDLNPDEYMGLNLSYDFVISKLIKFWREND